MKAALQRAWKAKAEKREKVKQSKASGYAPQFFFDIVQLYLTMLQQLYLDTAYADATLDDGTHVFSLLDPFTARLGHTLQVRLLNAWLSHTYYSIFEGNDTLVLHYDGGGEIRPDNVTIKLPHGNHRRHRRLSQR
jgi:hypothetical protein